MKNNLTILAGFLDGFRLSQISSRDLHTQGLKQRVASPGETPHCVALLEQLLHDDSPQKATSTRHQCFHETFLLAQRASCSRKILALCLTSTGKEG